MDSSATIKSFVFYFQGQSHGHGHGHGHPRSKIHKDAL